MTTKRKVFRAGFIEEPLRYDTLETWERHLAKMKAMAFDPDAVPSKVMMLRSAQETIAQMKRLRREFKAMQANLAEEQRAYRAARREQEKPFFERLMRACRAGHRLL